MNNDKNLSLFICHYFCIFVPINPLTPIPILMDIDVGYICETDTFASNRQIAEISEGDILCFRKAGDYCYTMASNYNSRPRPAEVLWIDGQAKLIRKAETLEDLLRNQVEIDL